MPRYNMEHSFNVEVAVEIGVNAAILLRDIDFWCRKNEANGKHLHDGMTWTYNSIKAFCELYPYMGDKQVRNALKKLQEKGYIKVGNFNKAGYDRTQWYAVTEEGENLLNRCGTTIGERANGIGERANASCQKGEPIPYTNTYTNTEEEEEAGWQEVVKCYQNNIRPICGTIELEKLSSLHKDYGKEWVLSAIEECVSNNVRNLNYLTAILDRWKVEGFKRDSRKKQKPAAKKDSFTAEGYKVKWFN